MPKVSAAHVEGRRKQILAAACRCFSRNGVHGTTVRDICREAGLSTGAVYGYFKSKGEIVEGIAALGRANTRELLFGSVKSAEPARALAEVMATAVDGLEVGAVELEQEDLEPGLLTAGQRVPRLLGGAVELVSAQARDRHTPRKISLGQDVDQQPVVELRVVVGLVEKAGNNAGSQPGHSFVVDAATSQEPEEV